VHNSVPQFGRHCLKISERHPLINRGIVDEHIYRPECIEYLVAEVIYGVWIAVVCREGEHPTRMVGGQLSGDILRQRQRRLTYQCDMCSVSSKCGANRLAATTSAACYDCD